MKNRILIGVLIGVVVVGALLALHLARRPREPGSYKIGAILPLTQSATAIGEYAKNGIQLAIEEINETGGLNDKKIEAVYGDSKNSPKEGISVYRKMVSVDKLPVIVSVMSSVTTALVSFVEEDKVVLASTIVSAPGLADESKWIFRDFVTSEKECRTMTDFLLKNMQSPKMAVFYVNDEFGRGAMEVFGKYYERDGGKIIWSESFEKDKTDFRKQLFSLKPLNPEGVYVIGYGKPLAIAIKQISEVGIKGKIFSFSGLASPDVMEQAGSAAEGAFFSATDFDIEAPTRKESKEFLANYKSRFGKTPSHYAAYTYDLVKMIALAIKKKGYSPEKIREGLLSIHEYPGVIGTISILPNGEADFPMKIKEVKSGKAVEFESL